MDGWMRVVLFNLDFSISDIGETISFSCFHVVLKFGKFNFEAKKHRTGVNMQLTLEFVGGSERLLKCPQQMHEIELNNTDDDGRAWTLASLFQWIKQNMLLVNNCSMLICGNSVRPGILVLINEVDWELCNGLQYVLKPNDKVTFISTLHGVNR
ncbi:Ubiquitin-related modifier 1 -like protein [Trichinella murrelli]|uniref:Ubiquitin-related modifier 1 homolog n=1 Tax=Trichinella murrelli TaxID=144512 RepID=A0A0V0TPL6_9BILA|nr:Ubiquitin-related modifier 1 -like protein [Trichinella murrelli]